MSALALEIHDLHAWYGESHVLHGINLSVRHGEVVCLLGRNGAVGMAISAVLFAFLEVSSRSLELIDIAPETYVIMQGSILLSSVIAYEVIRRYKITLQSKELAKVVAA